MTDRLRASRCRVAFRGDDAGPMGALTVEAPLVAGCQVDLSDAQDAF